MPAFATSRSIGPSSRSVSATIRSTSACSVTSPAIASPSVSCATASTCACVRAETATRIPARVSSRATSAPIPRPPPVTSATPVSSDRIRDLLERLGILHRRQVAGVLAEHLRADRAAYDLRRAGLRQRADEHDPLRLERLPQPLRDLSRHVLLRRDLALRAHAEDPRDLALHLVRHADGGR